MRTRSRKFLAVLMTALALIAASCGGSGEEVSSVAPAAGNPDLPPQFFVADQVGGGQVDLGDYVGQDILLWFWAPW